MADAALKRYLTFDTPQTVIIGPWSHGAMYHADPFLPAEAAVEPSPAEQFDMLVNFFDAYLKDDGTPSARNWDHLLHARRRDVEHHPRLASRRGCSRQMVFW